MDAQTGIDATWWAGLDDGRILFQRCGRCAAPNFYPRLACSQCLSPDLHWQDCSGGGEVYAVTRVHRAPSKDHGAAGPYTVVLAEMDDGFRLLAKLREGSAAIRVGARVRATVDGGSDGRKAPVFESVET